MKQYGLCCARIATRNDKILKEVEDERARRRKKGGGSGPSYSENCAVQATRPRRNTKAYVVRMMEEEAVGILVTKTNHHHLYFSANLPEVQSLPSSWP